MMSNYEKAVDAINAVFGDTDVPRRETRKQLNDLIGEIEIMLGALDADEQREAEETDE